MSEIVFELVSPEGVLVRQEIKELVVKTEAGEIGILKDHAELKSTLIPGTLRYKDSQGQSTSLEIAGGVIEVSKNKIAVLTSSASIN